MATVQCSPESVAQFLQGEICDLSTVLSQLFMTQHTASVDYINDRVLRTNPQLLLIQSNHAVLGTKKHWFK